MPYPGMRPPRFLRARRPRPSEKTAFRVISRFSPLGHASWACLPRRGGLRTPAMTPLASPGHGPARRSPLGPAPLEGRAPHARMGTPWLQPSMSPLGHPASRLLLARHALPRACVRPCRPGAETAPLRENSLSRYLPVFTARPSRLGSPPPWRGGLRTPATTAQRQPQRCPLWPTGHR
jgi:hypothetical protein